MDYLNAQVRACKSDWELFESPDTYDAIAGLCRGVVNRFVGRYPQLRESEREELMAEGRAHAWKTRHNWVAAPNPARHLALSLRMHIHDRYFDYQGRYFGASRKDTAQLRKQDKSLPNRKALPEDADFLDQRERPQWLLDLVFDQCAEDRLNTRIVELRLMGYRPSEVANQLGLDHHTVTRRLAELHGQVKRALAPIWRRRRAPLVWRGRRSSRVRR